LYNYLLANLPFYEAKKFEKSWFFLNKSVKVQMKNAFFGDNYKP